MAKSRSINCKYSQAIDEMALVFQRNDIISVLIIKVTFCSFIDMTEFERLGMVDVASIWASCSKV